VAASGETAHAVAMRIFGKALVTLGMGLMMAAPAASAEATAGGNSGWVPTETPSFTLPAGAACSFELHGEVVYDHELTRILQTFPDGSPKVQEFQGALGVVYTNVESGESARRDGSGTLRATHDGNGGIEFVFEGNGIAPIFAGSPSPGIYVTSGHIVLLAHPNGSREFTEVRGTVENMCETLA